METLAEYLGLDKKDEPRQRLSDLSARDFAKKIIDSEEWRLSVYDRVSSGRLPPPLEMRLLDLAWSKAQQPDESKAISTTDMTLDEAKTRVYQLIAVIREMEAREAATQQADEPELLSPDVVRH